MPPLPVIDFRKQLQTSPEVRAVAGVRVRHYREEADIERWLAVRNAAFADLPRGNRTWTRADFQREFLDKWWWQLERLFLAEDVESGSVVGVVGLARRGRTESSKPAIHWLAVHPNFQHHGIARVLLSHAEHALWQSGERQLFAQTHESWTAAVTFYERNGFVRWNGIADSSSTG